MNQFIAGICLGITLTVAATWADHDGGSVNIDELRGLQFQQRQLQNEQREGQQLDRMLRNANPC
jgi:hypothetical protein